MQSGIIYIIDMRHKTLLTVLFFKMRGNFCMQKTNNKCYKTNCSRYYKKWKWMNSCIIHRQLIMFLKPASLLTQQQILQGHEYWQICKHCLPKMWQQDDTVPDSMRYTINFKLGQTFRRQSAQKFDSEFEWSH